MILVIGATGTVGKEVVSQLAAGGHAARALTRNAAKARFDGKVEVAVGDLGTPDSLTKALAGVDSVFSVALGASIAQHEGNLVAAAKKAGVKRIVKLSVLGAGSGSKNPIVAWHEEGEAVIRASGLGWTFVRPGGFMSNALQWAGTIKSMGKFFGPYGDGKMPVVHPKDIAAVAVKALVTPGHDGQAYPLTGGEALSMADQARILGEAIGKPVQYVPVDDAAARDGMSKSGMPAGLIDALLQMAAGVRAGQAAEVLPTVAKVLGRPALTFTDWARENAAAFK